MNKSLIALLCVALTFGACVKKQSTPQPHLHQHEVDDSSNLELPVDTSLTISGISDIRTTVWGQNMLNLTVTRNSGLEQKVTMSVTGLPENAKAEFTAISGYTTFNTYLQINTVFTKPGIYPLVITSSSETGKTKDYNVNLIVDTPTKVECNEIFLNAAVPTLSTTDLIIDSVVFTGTALLLNNTFDAELYLYNVVLSYDNNFTRHYRSFQSSNNYHVRIEFDCEKGILTIPDQDVSGRAISGGMLKTFSIRGEGSVDTENNTFEITYITEHDDGGTNIIKSFTLKGRLR